MLSAPRACSKNAPPERCLAGTGNGNFAQRIIAAIIGDSDAAERIAEALIGDVQKLRPIDTDRHAAGRIAVELNAVAEVILKIERPIARRDVAHAARAKALQLQPGRGARRIAQAIAGAARAALEQIERKAAMLLARDDLEDHLKCV